MIPEYRLINHLLLLKSNYFFKREIKKILATLPGNSFRTAYHLVFNHNKNLMFMKVISVYLELNKINYKENIQLVANFILTITALSPVFLRQTKYLGNYEHVKNILLHIGTQHMIKQWYNENLPSDLLPDFLNKSALSTEQINQIAIIKKLMHISGQMFVHLNNKPTNISHNYNFGKFLMLFYILDLETRKTLLNRDITSFNLKSIIPYQQLFTNKLLILDSLINSAMFLEPINFNLYIRIMNYTLLGNYE